MLKSTYLYKLYTFSLLLILFIFFSSTNAYSQTAKPLSGDALILKHNATYANPASGFSTIFIDGGVVKVQRSDGTTKAAIFLTDLSATSPLSYNNGTGAFSLAGLSSLGTANYVVGVNSGATAWEYKQLIAGTNITITPGTGSITIDASGGGGSTAFNDIGDATGAGSVANAANAQEWTWNTLAGATGLKLSSTSTAAASNLQRLFEVAQSGANGTSTQTTYSSYFTNTKTGTSSTNVAGYFSSSGGSNNYAIIIPSSGGRFGLGTSTPLANMDFGSDATAQKLLIYSSSNVRYGLGQDGSGMRIFGSDTGNINLGFVSNSDGSTFTSKTTLSTTALDLNGTNHNLTFSGGGAIGFGGSPGTGAKIDFNTTLPAQGFLTYRSGNTKNGIGVASGQQRYFVAGGTASIHAFGIMSTSDGSTFTNKVGISDTTLDLTGSSHNLTFTGNGGIILGGGTTLNTGSKISFGNNANAQAIALFHNGNTKHYIGIATNQTIIASPTSAYTSIGNVSTSDGTTFTEYYRFNQNGALDITQGTITSSQPFINHTATLNSGATTFSLFKSNVTNTASASASTFIDLQTSSTSRFKVDLSGQITTNEANGIVHNLGYLKVGHFFDAGTGYSGIANAAMTNLNTEYAVLQEGLGATFVNAKSGTTLSFRLGNTEYGLLSGTKWDFSAATSGVAKRNPHAAKTSNYTILTTDSGGVFTNVNALGDVTFSLPAASAGLEYHFYVTDNQNLIVDANGTDTIRIAASVSASGGNLTANTVGNSLTVRYIGTGQWGVFASQGTWTVN
jgi:hypothetical protein